MTRARFRRPASTVAIQAIRDARRSERQRLESQPDVRVTELPTGEILGARQDVFTILLTRKSLCQTDYNAVRRLEADFAQARGVDKPEPSRDRVSGGQRTCDLDRRIDAADRAAAALCEIDGTHAILLQSLLLPHFAGQIAAWRNIVQAITGARTPITQTRIVVTACAALSQAYLAVDYQRKRAA